MRTSKLRIRSQIARLAVSAAMGALTMALLPASALASAPQITTDGVTVTGGTSATLSGNGNADGTSTALRGHFALASELWCTSKGAEGSSHETGEHPLGSSNAEISEILVELTGLEPSSEYCAELIAVNEDGTSHGGQISFTTPTPPTIVSDAAASHITATDATLEATINPKGQETTYEFFVEDPWCGSFGPGSCEASGGQLIYKGSIPAGSTDQTVSVDIASVWHQLSADTAYGYRLVATNSANATAFGSLKNLTTPTPPSIDSESVSHITSTDATLEATINTQGLEASYQFKMWASPCSSKGSGCELIMNVPLPSGNLLGSSVEQSVSLDLSSAGVQLTPGGEYGYSVSATSTAGTTQGEWHTFEAAAAPASTPPPVGTTSSSHGSHEGPPPPPPPLTTGPSKSKSGHPGKGKHHAKHKHHKRHHKHHPRKRAKHRHRNY